MNKQDERLCEILEELRDHRSLAISFLEIIKNVGVRTPMRQVLLETITEVIDQIKDRKIRTTFINARQNIQNIYEEELQDKSQEVEELEGLEEILHSL